MNVEKKLSELGIQLPETAAPLAMYVPATQAGNILYISGQGPFVDGKPQYVGKVGKDLSLEDAQAAARICIINMLAVIKNQVGDLNKVKTIASIQAFVSSETGFDQQHIVINAASQLLFAVFGEAGRHARTAVGTNQLPLDIPVEIMGTVVVEE